MPIAGLLASLIVHLGSGLAGAICRRSDRFAAWAAGGAVVAGIAGLGSALSALLWPHPVDWSTSWPWLIGRFHVGLDPLSVVFLLPIFVLTAVGAIYATGYWRSSPPARVAEGWLFFNVLTVGMSLLVVARDAVLFMAAWELMTIASFRLVALEPERPGVVRAAWIYLAASQAGAACLLAMFLRLGVLTGTTDFAAFAGFAQRAPAATPSVLALGLIGFGLKAGLMPLHGWLPLAHPAAPSPVSAVMSGVMIKTGIYGIARLTLLAGHPPVVWGWLLLAVGIVSSVGGVLYALRQHDLKRLLAYHSVENIGIITLGMGLGVVATAAGTPTIAFWAWAGAFFHVANHAIFKGLLFLGAGAVMHRAGTGTLDRLGGLLRRMPWTGWTFLIGSAAISGLPPFNGFASEFLIYAGGFQSLMTASRALATGGVFTLAALALTGGLAAACFAKVFGIAFLGEPRDAGAAGAREVGWNERAPLLILAALCLLFGIGAPVAVRPPAAAATILTRRLPGAAPLGLGAWLPLRMVAMAGASLLVLATLLFALARGLLTRRSVRYGPTWDCGYLRPSARMQYTATGFAQPLLDAFHLGPLSRHEVKPPRAFFAEKVVFDSHGGSLRKVQIDKLLARLRSHVDTLRWMQHGNVHLYVLYIALTLLALLLGVFR